MYLATTALDQYWDKNKKILLLGEWCIADNLVLEELDYEVMPYHWNSTFDMADDMNYMYSKYVELIPQLSKHLNKINSTELSIKYWHFLVGPWLFKFLNIFIDRYKSLEKASELGYKLETVIVPDKYVPESCNSLYQIVNKDGYNYLLYSDIIKYSKLQISYDEIDSSINKGFTEKKYMPKKTSSQLNLTYLRKLLSNILSPNKRESLLRKIIDYNKSDGDVQIVASPLNNKDERDFFNALNHKPNSKRIDIKTIVPALNKPTNKDLRSEPIFSEDDDQFTQTAKKLIMRYIPKEYLEYFHEWSSLSKSDSFGYAKNPKTIIIRCPLETLSLFRYYCAEKLEKGSKIIGLQHGGGYGVRPFKGFDEVEAGLCDLYLNWGWRSNLKNVKPFFLTKTGWIDDYKYKKNGNILLLGCGLRKFFEDSQPQPPSFNNIHLDLNSRFIKRLSSNVKKRLIYRFHHDCGFKDQEKIKTLFPDIRTSTREVDSHFYRLLSSSSIVVATSNHTTFLQTFTVNHPTLILWPEDFNLLPESVSPYYKLLKEAGILYHNPESCADKLNDINNNLMEWWLNDDVQTAKNEFCENICKSSKDLGLELAHIVKSINKDI